MSTFPGTSKREKQYQAHRAFGDRRDGVVSARTYFYANEAKCDSHMETFLRCIEASGRGGVDLQLAAYLQGTILGRSLNRWSLRFKFVKKVGTTVSAEPGSYSSCAMSSALLPCLTILPLGAWCPDMELWS